MTMQYVRDCYGVPARRGGRVLIDNGSVMLRKGRITSACGAHLRVRLDGEKHTRIYHPRDLFYLGACARMTMAREPNNKDTTGGTE